MSNTAAFSTGFKRYETPTFRRIDGRWHVAVLCEGCGDPIWHDVHEHGARLDMTNTARKCRDCALGPLKTRVDGMLRR